MRQTPTTGPWEHFINISYEQLPNKRSDKKGLSFPDSWKRFFDIGKWKKKGYNTGVLAANIVVAERCPLQGKKPSLFRV